jgi:hypothetical protein
MPLGSLICRRKLDEERGNPWICECPMCQEERKAKEPQMKEDGEEAIHREKEKEAERDILNHWLGGPD